MTDELKIRTLTERFFDGETTHEEEQALYEYYQTGDVPEDLMDFRTMFMDMAAMEAEIRAAEEHHTEGVAEGKRSLFSRLPYPFVAAASIACLLAIGTTLYYHHVQQDEYVAYIYGKKVTDKEVVMAELARTARSMTATNNTDNVEQQLREIFK